MPLVLPVLVVEVPALELSSCWIRLCKLASKPAGPESVLVLLVPPVLLVLALPVEPCACNADIRLCKNALIACSPLCAEVVEDADDEDVLEPAALVRFDEEPPTPIEDNASAMAPNNPPPPPGGGGGRLDKLSVELVEFVEFDELPERLLNWLSNKS